MSERMVSVPVDVATEAVNCMARAYERVHSLPRVSDTKLANRVGVAKEALRIALTAAPVREEGGAVSDDQQPGELELAIRELLWPYFESAKLGHFTHENDCSRAARQIAGALKPGFYLSRFLPALATREEAPAEAGEIIERLAKLAEIDGSCPGWVVVKQSDLRIAVSALRAQPPARDLAAEIDDVKKMLEADGQAIEYFEAQRRVAAFKALRGTEADKRAVSYIDAAVLALQAREDAQPVAWPETCDGTEQPAFEEWATKRQFDMNEHPLHYLFLDPKTDAARQGWKAGLEHAVERMKQGTLPAPEAEKLRAAVEAYNLMRSAWSFRQANALHGDREKYQWACKRFDEALDASDQALAALQQGALSAAPGEAK